MELVRRSFVVGTDTLVFSAAYVLGFTVGTAAGAAVVTWTVAALVLSLFAASLAPRRSASTSDPDDRSPADRSPAGRHRRSAGRWMYLPRGLFGRPAG